VVRVCERISGSIGCWASQASASFPVKTARPIEADTPHRNVANAMNRYPRRGCGVDLEFWEFSPMPPAPMMTANRRSGQAGWDRIR